MTYPSNGILVVASLMMMYNTTRRQQKGDKPACWLRGRRRPSAIKPKTM
jgi:hypothetical protein